MTELTDHDSHPISPVGGSATPWHVSLATLWAFRNSRMLVTTDFLRASLEAGLCD